MLFQRTSRQPLLLSRQKGPFSLLTGVLPASSSESVMKPRPTSPPVTLRSQAAASACCQSEFLGVVQGHISADLVMQHYCHICCVESPWSVIRIETVTFLRCTDATPDYKFDLMYSKRAFVHWYVGEGMEEVCRLLNFLCTSKSSSRRRVNFQRPERISLHWRRITRR